RSAFADRGGLADEDEEGGLEGVFGISLVGQHAAADAEHHFPVAAHQTLERVLIALSNERLQELPVARLGVVPVEQAAQIASDPTHVLIPPLQLSPHALHSFSVASAEKWSRIFGFLPDRASRRSWRRSPRVTP